jgi:hypothetical protein
MCKDGKMLDSKSIEREIHDLVVAKHVVKIVILDGEVFKAHKVHISYYKLWDTKQKEITRIYGDCGKSYEILPKFMLAI